jgi:hypothetical protein
MAADPRAIRRSPAEADRCVIGDLGRIVGARGNALYLSARSRTVQRMVLGV